MPDLLAKAFSASLAAVCGTAPVSLLTFGTFIPAGIFAATAAAPIMLVFMWIALASALLAIPLPVIGRITAPLLEVLHSVLAWILASGAAFPIFEAGLAPIGRILASLLIVSLIALIYAIPWASWRKSRQKTEEFYRRASFVDIKKMLIRLDPPE
jgi:predicted membrane metal-binding protein